MHKFSAPANHSERLAIVALVMISVGSLLVVNEIGGIVLAAIFHAMQSKVRARTHVLQDLAYRDGLTGLPNRRFFNWYLEQYLPRQAEQGSMSEWKTSLVLFDLNGFKAVNDTHGHDAGDELLKYLSESLSASLPSDVLLARLGGEASIGVSTTRSDHPDVGSMLREADARMYDDKAASKQVSSKSILQAPMTVELEV